jgi:PAS domain S-box-containing protein
MSFTSPFQDSPIRVLLIDDDESSQLLISHMLSKVPARRFKTEVADTYESGLAMIRKRQHDVYLLDYRLGARTGLDLLKEAIQGDVSGPIILLTAAADPKVDWEATEIGAADFLLKDKLDSVILERSIRYSLQHFAAMRALQKSNEQFRLLFERSMDAILISDDHGQFLEVNGAACTLLGYSADQLRQMRLSDFVAFEAGTIVKHLQNQPLSELSINSPDGDPRYVEFSTCQFAPGLNLILMRDITDRRNLEKAIQEASEKEQRKLGQDLHDGLGQTLTGIGCLAKVLQQKLAAKKLPEAGEADTIAKLLSQALSQTREIARGLCPVVLEKNDIQAALKQLSDTLESFFGVSSNMICDPKLKINDNAIATHLFRIAQEASTNAVRHGKATEVNIKLTRRSGQLILQVRDNGVGFPEGKLKSQGMGLRVMQHRARMIRGSLDVERLKEGGTVVTCSLEAPSTRSKSSAAAQELSAFSMK